MRSSYKVKTRKNTICSWRKPLWDERNVDWPPLQKSASLAWISSHSLAWYCPGTGSAAQKKRLKPWKRRENLEQYRKPEVFLGLVNYCGPFIPDLATVSEPLRCLTKSIGSCWDFEILRQRCPNPCNCWCQPSWTGSGTHPKAEEWWQKPREDIRRQRKRRWRSYGPAKSSIPMCMVCHLILLQFTSRRKLSTAEGQNPVHALKDGCYECSHTNSRWCMSLDRVTLLTSSQG